MCVCVCVYKERLLGFLPGFDSGILLYIARKKKNNKKKKKKKQQKFNMTLFCGKHLYNQFQSFNLTAQVL